MKRAGQVMVAAALAAAPLVATGQLHPVEGSSQLCPQPGIGSVSPQVAAVGSTVTLGGSGFSPGGPGQCQVTVSIGGVAQQAVQVAGDTTLRFQVTSGSPGAPIYGPVVVTSSDTLGNTNSSSSGGDDPEFITAPTLGNAPTAPPERQGFTLSGAGLQAGGLLSGATVSYSTAMGSCPAPYRLSGAAVSDGAVSVAGIPGWCDGSLSLTLAVFADSQRRSTMAVGLGPVPVDVAAVTNSGPPGVVAAGSPAVALRGSGFGAPAAGTGGDFAVASWSDSVISVAVPDAAVSGRLSLRRADGSPLVSQPLQVQARIIGVSPTSAATGDAVTISGSGFGPGGGRVSLGSTALPVRSWSPTSVVVTIADGAVSGALALTPGGANLAPAAAPTITVLPRLTGVNPAHAGPGGVLEVLGTGFGSRPGVVSIGGKPAQITLWGEHQIVVSVPAGAAPGASTLTVTVPGAPGPVSIGLVVDAVPAAASSAQPGRGLIAPSAGGPVITTKPVPFSKPPKAASPVDLGLSAVRATADPGSEVPLTVTLTAFGKPVAGSEVTLLMVVEPGSDAVITPDHGVTDDHGQLHGVLRLSRRAGDHIVLARSGIYSDEIRVVGRAITAASLVRDNSASSGGLAGLPRNLILFLLYSVAVLFGLGFAINLATLRHAAGSGSVSAARNSTRSSGPLQTLGAITQFAAAMAVIVTGQLLARLRRR
jgi:hypothetical protein